MSEVDDVNDRQHKVAYLFMQRNPNYKQSKKNGQILADLANEAVGNDWTPEVLEELFQNNLTKFDVFSKAEMQQKQAPRVKEILPWQSPLTFAGFRALSADELRAINSGKHAGRFWTEYQTLLKG